MKTLLLLRHAKSSWKEKDISDHDRPLNKRGKHDAPVMGRLLKENSLVPDLIVSSTAKRAIKTARLVAESCGYDEVHIQIEPHLYLAPRETYTQTVKATPDSVNILMLVGHNPGIEQFLSQIIDYEEPMPTAALAVLSLTINKWSNFSTHSDAQLKYFWRPKELSE